jgi:hypothetical protein
VAATARAGSFSGQGVVAAKEAGAPYHPAPARNGEQPGTARTPESQNGGERQANPTHASEVTPHQPAAAPSSGDPKLDKKYQQQQAQLAAKQNQEHQKLQQQQEKEDNKPANSNPNRKQMVEQQHQNQTQQMEQRHTQQQQQLQTRQVPRTASKPR